MMASRLYTDLSTHACPIGQAWTLDRFDGKWVFVGALGLVLIWLIVMPQRFVGQPKDSPWWRQVRLWAIVICITQMWIYWRFG